MTSVLFTSDSPESTQAFARRIGAVCADRLILLLTGDLGSGKTCFVQGLAQGLEVPDDEAVSSPTYALMNHYRGRFDLYHFDLYRLAGGEELEELGFDEIFAGPGVKAVEWPGLLDAGDIDGVRVRFSYGEGDNERILALEPFGPGGAALLAGLEPDKETR